MKSDLPVKSRAVIRICVYVLFERYTVQDTVKSCTAAKCQSKMLGKDPLFQLIVLPCFILSKEQSQKETMTILVVGVDKEQLQKQ